MHITMIAVIILGIGCGSQYTQRRKLARDRHTVAFSKRPYRNELLQRRENLQSNEKGNCLHNLCSNVASYPINYIRGEMQKRTEFHEFFGSVIQPYSLPRLMEKAPKMGYEDRNLCETIQFTYFPEAALNKNSKRMFIVNVDKFRQAVSFETCIPKAKCFLDDHKPLGYETACKQQYNLIRLVSMDDDGNFTLDSFPVPSSCVCTYRRTADFGLT